MKKGQAILVAPLQPHTLAAFRPWGILRELVARDLPHCKDRAQPVRTLRFMNKISVAAPHGVYAALGSFVLMLAVYLIQSEWMVEWWVSLSSTALNLVFMFVACSAFTPGGMAKNTVWALAFWAVLSLVVAAIMKRAPKSEFA